MSLIFQILMVVFVDQLIGRTLKGSRSRSNKLSREESQAEQKAEAEYSLNQDANHTTEQTKLSESFEQTDVIAEGELFNKEFLQKVRVITHKNLHMSK